MAHSDRREDARLTESRTNWLAQLGAAPWAFDFYQVMRRIEGFYPGSARIGESRRLTEDAVRLGQHASMDFAPANVHSIARTRSGGTRIAVRFLGLFGPQGPLPAHMTEIARDREMNAGDETLARFADVFHHRQLSLFYRAWRQAQPTASRDRPDGDRFMTYVGALIGEAGQGWRQRDSLGDTAKRYYAGVLGRGPRNPGGLLAILRDYFGVPFELQPFAARWVSLPPGQRTRLDGTAGLARGAVIGRRVFDAQHQVTLTIGPLTLEEFERFLPGAPWHRALMDWVRRYCDDVLQVAGTLCLRADQIPGACLAGAAIDGSQPAGARLGLTSWLGRRPTSAGDATDLSLRLSASAG